MLTIFLFCFSSALQTPDSTSVEAAVTAIHELQDANAQDYEIAQALAKLAVIDDPEAAESLFAIVQKLDSTLRVTAVKAIEFCPNANRDQVLQRLLTHSKHWGDRIAAASVLVKTAEGRNWMIQKFSKLKDAQVKATLFGSLERGKSEDRILLKAIKDKSQIVRSAAILATSRLGLDDARTAALKALNGRNLIERTEAVYACATFGGEKAFMALAKLALERHGPDFHAELWRGLRMAKELDEVEVLCNTMLKARDEETQVFLAQCLIKAGVNRPAVAGAAFGRLLERRNNDLRILALRGIEATAYEESLPLIIELLDHEDPRIRSDAVRALSSFHTVPETYAEQISEMSRDKNPAVRVSATMALNNVPREIALPALAERLKDEVWSVQDVAVGLLGGMRTVSATRLLAEHMNQSFLKGIVRELTYEHLKAHTGQDFGPTSASWSRWLNNQSDDYELPEIDKAKAMLKTLEAKQVADNDKYGAVTYHNIPVQSGGVIFILDRSKSMGEKFSFNAQLLHEYFSQELIATIKSLRGDHHFNLIFFSDRATSWKPNLVQADEQSKKAAVEYVAHLRPGGSTQLAKAIELAFLDKDVQQIYIMTDGDPSGGEMMKATIIDRVMELNRHRRIRIHTIVAGDVHGEFLKELATTHGGTCVDLR
ncbi:MAG: HEAT repeat domain-containing protein [Planctomycetes bacterium]|nr:HEAT repeat domain-containing protein [Planctomycetota bacterium]